MSTHPRQTPRVLTAGRPAWSSIAIALIAFAAYAAIMPPFSGMGDSSEITLVLATGGVAHPTGYPLYTLLGHPFCVLLHTLGLSWSRSAALWSAAGGGLAIYFLHRLGVELAGDVQGRNGTARIVAALVPTALFAFQPVVRGEATHAEVNAWGLAWACATTWAFVRVVRSIHSDVPAAGRGLARGAAIWGLACGAGLAHHLTSLWISVPLSAGLLVALARRRRFKLSLVWTALGAALVPLTSYAYIAWHAWHPATVQWAQLEPSWASVFQHVTGSQYRVFLGYFAPSAPQRELLASGVYPFLIPGLALLLLAAARARRAEERIVGWTLFAAATLGTAFAFRYGVEDPAPYFLAPMVLGVAATAWTLATIPSVGSRAWTTAVAIAGLAAVIPIIGWLRDANEERKATILFERLIRSMWSAIPSDTAIVSWTDDRFNRLVEYQLLRGEKPAVVVITPDMLYANTVRERFRRRFGVDPLAGFTPPDASLRTPEGVQAIQQSRRRLIEHLNARVQVPVILFDPTVPIVFQLRKPWEPRDTSGTWPARPH